LVERLSVGLGLPSQLTGERLTVLPALVGEATRAVILLPLRTIAALSRRSKDKGTWVREDPGAGNVTKVRLWGAQKTPTGGEGVPDAQSRCE